jgi:hypothetical protein
MLNIVKLVVIVNLADVSIIPPQLFLLILEPNDSQYNRTKDRIGAHQNLNPIFR